MKAWASFDIGKRGDPFLKILLFPSDDRKTRRTILFRLSYVLPSTPGLNALSHLQYCMSSESGMLSDRMRTIIVLTQLESSDNNPMAEGPSAVGQKRRACTNCTNGKAKCSPFSVDECQRCHRLGKECVYSNISTTRKRPRTTR